MNTKYKIGQIVYELKDKYKSAYRIKDVAVVNDVVMYDLGFRNDIAMTLHSRVEKKYKFWKKEAELTLTPSEDAFIEIEVNLNEESKQCIATAVFRSNGNIEELRLNVGNVLISLDSSELKKLKEFIDDNFDLNDYNEGSDYHL